MSSSIGELQERGLTVDYLKNQAAGSLTEEVSTLGTRLRRMRKCFQKTVKLSLDRQFQVDPISHMREKLERWNLGGQPGATARRLVQALARLRKVAPPRVCAAVLRTCWNGWCTERRFQKVGHCVFGCTELMQEDSLEHYAGCSVCVGCLRRKIRYMTPTDRGHLVSLGCHRQQPRDEELGKLALWNYVLYSSFKFPPVSSGKGG